MTHVSTRLGKNAAQTIKYFAVAGGVMVFYLALYSAGVLVGLHYFISILLAQMIAISVAFPLYRNVVFLSTGKVLRDFVKFLSVWASGALAGLVATPLLVEVWGVGPIIAQVASVVVVGAGSFLAHKFFSFRVQSSTNSDGSQDKDEEL